ncbi:7TM diverse intracellular signaling domain-containing protein [Niabella terrae]
MIQLSIIKFCLFLFALLPQSDQIIPVENFTVFIDQENRRPVEEIIRMHPQEFKTQELRPHSVNWIRLRVSNNLGVDPVYLEIKNPLFEDLRFYSVAGGRIYNTLNTGRGMPFKTRPFQSPNFIYPVYFNGASSVTVFIRAVSDTPVHVPMYVGTSTAVTRDSLNSFLLMGVYLGIIVIMIFYNLFVYFTVRDKSYIYYILYIFTVGIAQLVLSGFAFKYFWPNNIWLSIHSFNLSGICSGVATALFSQVFLNTRTVAPRLHRVFNLLIFTYLIALVVTFLISEYIAFNIINLVAGVGSVIAILTGLVLSRKGYREAKFFLLAFSVFLVAVMIYVLRTINVIPFNVFTEYILEIGSTIQILLLSFALADKINIYRAEQVKAKKEALEASEENERLVREQNIILERQVNERTSELQEANGHLSQALSQLKQTQMKLVETEKMASLGQLTAGIAHEINNPINFVASNVKPLELDIQDLISLIDKYDTLKPDESLAEQLAAINAHKEELNIGYINEEINMLLAGIKEGAQRTAEIVSNLKSFVRVDEDNLKMVDLNQGLEATLRLIKSSFPTDMTLIKELGPIPEVECNPGKINQVFMNIITNAAQAISENQERTGQAGVLTIRTFHQDEQVVISIKDNGMGMSTETQQKIFDPFYTTKPVGQGTGLGMSIVKNIIDNHHGKIDIVSKFGAGTEFIITLSRFYQA